MRKPTAIDSATNKYIETVFEWFHDVPMYGKLFTVYAMTGVLAVIDSATGYEFGFSLFYLAPIATAAWFISNKSGLFFSVLCGVVWGVLDLRSGHEYSNYIFPIWNAIMRIGFYFVVAKLLAATKLAFEKERTLSRTDFLTGVCNSRYLVEMLDRELEMFKRHGREFIVAYVDLDHFKKVNDVMGHSEGDRVLKVAAKTMSFCFRKIDLIGRMGGDEFVVVMPATTLENAELVLKRMEARLLEEMKNNKWPVTFSIGVIKSHVNHNTVDDVIRAADTLMYKAKSQGKNTIIFERAS